MRLLIIILCGMFSFLTVGCSKSGNNISVHPPLEGITDAHGGRARIAFEWDADQLPSGVAKVRVYWNGTRNYKEFTLPQTPQVILEIEEGTYQFTVNYLDAHGTILVSDQLSGSSYGTQYESGLKLRAATQYTFSGTGCAIKLAVDNNQHLTGQEVSYKDLDLESKSVVYPADRSIEQPLSITDLGGDVVRHRSVYTPSKLGDPFYSSFELLYADNQSYEPYPTIDGYRGIWFELNQKTTYGDKYSGGLGTYTMKHIPMAVYAEEVDRTYFVFGGTPSSDKRLLRCMIGCYDHKTDKLSKPVIVFDKGEVNDPHDDPTVQLDNKGYVWVFVSGRANNRKGKRFRSVRPYDISSFTYIDEGVMAYPQPMYSPEKGFFLFFTRYDGTRQLYWQTSLDGANWTPYKQLASIKEGAETNSGHYQISNILGNKVVTFFNRHPNGDVDRRTNIYCVQSTDWGESWTTPAGDAVDVPVVTRNSNALVKDFQSLGLNVYIKDVNFDAQGNPIALYLTSKSYIPGPEHGAREWYTVHWDGTQWNHSYITSSTHCYDSGSLWVDNGVWTVIAPTTDGPQKWGAGGEIVMWKSYDNGFSWSTHKMLTNGSIRNNGYVRRPLYASDKFYAFWADGNADQFGLSYLYFCDKDGNVRRMPYTMTGDWASPEQL